MIQVNNIRNVSDNNFINLPYHQITENGVTSYVTLQKNTILELYFNKDIDSKSYTQWEPGYSYVYEIVN